MGCHPQEYPPDGELTLVPATPPVTSPSGAVPAEPGQVSRHATYPADPHRSELEDRLLGRWIPVGDGQLVGGAVVLIRVGRVPVAVVERHEQHPSRMPLIRCGR